MTTKDKSKKTLEPKTPKTKSAKSKKEKAEALAAPAVPVEVDLLADQIIALSEIDFIKRLTEKVSQFDAYMTLEAAMLSAGVPRQEGPFKRGQARDICLALIKRGGPAFAVGSNVYREFLSRSVAG